IRSLIVLISAPRCEELKPAPRCCKADTAPWTSRVVAHGTERRGLVYQTFLRAQAQVEPFQGLRRFRGCDSQPGDRVTTGTILLVEDHEDNRNIYRTILEHFGFHVQLATDGEEGVKLAREGKPDL